MMKKFLMFFMLLSATVYAKDDCFLEGYLNGITESYRIKSNIVVVDGIVYVTPEIAQHPLYESIKQEYIASGALGVQASRPPQKRQSQLCPDLVCPAPQQCPAPPPVAACPDVICPNTPCPAVSCPDAKKETAHLKNNFYIPDFSPALRLKYKIENNNSLISSGIRVSPSLLSAGIFNFGVLANAGSSLKDNQTDSTGSLGVYASLETSNTALQASLSYSVNDERYFASGVFSTKIFGVRPYSIITLYDNTTMDITAGALLGSDTLFLVVKGSTTSKFNYKFTTNVEIYPEIYYAITNDLYVSGGLRYIWHTKEYSTDFALTIKL